NAGGSVAMTDVIPWPRSVIGLSVSNRVENLLSNHRVIHCAAIPRNGSGPLLVGFQRLSHSIPDPRQIIRSRRRQMKVPFRISSTHRFKLAMLLALAFACSVSVSPLRADARAARVVKYSQNDI